jgi:hypothetical protein
MGAETPGWRPGVKLRSREAVHLWAQGFTRDDSPGEDEWRWKRGRFGGYAARVEHHAADTTSQAAASVRGEPRSGF